MASRQVRKLLQAQAEAELAKHAIASDEDDESEQAGASKPFNPFDLLSDEEGEVRPADDEEEEDADGPADADAPAQKPASAAKPSSSNKKSGSKKGKKGKKGGTSAAAGGKQQEQSGNAAGQAAQGKGDSTSQAAGSSAQDDIDRLVQELNLATVGPSNANGGAAGSEGGTGGEASPLLAVDPRALRGDDELRRIFGASVIQAVDREELADAAARRRHAAGVRGRPGAGRRLMKRGVLVTPKDHWPPHEGGLSMEYLGIRDGVKHFQYTWSPNYRSTQRAFEECQASFDPNAIAALLHHSPYHVDSLLAMYDLYRHLGENQYAEESLARALYALESAWHPQFDIRTANCRLDFEREENRALFLALFRHVQGLSRAGCHRTAFELTKLLLALQPEDPLGATCLIDYLAIRAGQYSYLKDFVARFEGDDSLSLRPNFAYALALAAQREQQQQQQESPQGHQGQEEEQSPEQLLTQAILLHPSVVPRILSKLQEKGSGREAHWATLLSRKLFTSPHDTGSASLQHLVSIYVEKSALLWKAPDALELLRSAATAAADIAEGGSKKSGHAGQGSSKQASGGSLGLEDWACVRREAFPDDEGRNDFRHLRLADFSDNVNALPREELQAAMGPAPAAAGGGGGGGGRGGGIVLPPPVRGQPGVGRGAGGGRRGAPGGANVQQLLQGLPPGLAGLDEEALMELQEQILMAQQQAEQAGAGGAGGGAAGAGAGAAGMSEEEMRQTNPVLMLLRSLLPWVNVGQQPEYGEEGGEAGDEGEGTGDPQ